MVDLIGNITTMIEVFTNIALSDPLSAVALATGSLFFAFSFAVFGYLLLGAVADTVTPDLS